MLALGAATASGAMAAGTAGTWTATGPACGNGTPDFESSGGVDRVSYLAAYGRIFRSNGASGRWTRVGPELPDAFVADTAISPGDPQTGYAAYFGYGLFRTSDGGETWTDATSGLPSRSISAVTTTPASTNTVFATPAYSGLFRSRDAGTSWVDISPPVADNVFGFTVHPLQPSRLWIATSNHGIWRSDDEGESWAAVNGGFGNVNNSPLGKPALDPADPAVAFVVKYNDLYRTDDATTWRAISVIPSDSYSRAVTVTPGPNRVILAGRDGSATARDGVLRSLDDGVSWEPSGLHGRQVLELRWLATLDRVLAHTEIGLYWSTDLGASWQAVPTQGASAGRVERLLALSGDGAGDEVIAGLSCSTPLAASSNGGWTWATTFVDRFVESATSLAVAPSDRRRLLAGVQSGVVRSSDGGLSWQWLPFLGSHSGARVRGLAIDALDRDHVLAATENRGLLESRDGGISWHGTEAPPGYRDGNDVAYDPFVAHRWLWAPETGLLISRNDGTSWIGVDAVSDYSLSRLAFSPTQPGLVMALTPYLEHAVIRSVDGGATWEANGLGIEGMPYDLAFDPEQPGRAVVATESGTFLSSDNGDSWQRLDDGPPAPTSVAFGRGGRLYVGTATDGVHSLAMRTYPTSCEPDATTACLLGGRFEVRGTMVDFADPPRTFPISVMQFPTERAASNQTVFLDSFSPGNFEVGVKMVDGCQLPSGHPLRSYWVFASGLTNAATDLRVTDTATGQQYHWQNPAGQLPTALADTGALPCVEGVPNTSCQPGDHTACLLGGRFEVTGTMQDFASPPKTYPTRVMSLPGGRGETTHAAFFESFAAGNFELGIKMVDACTLPADHPLRAYWAFYSGLTNAGSHIEVTHVGSGATHRWSNRAGTLPRTVADTAAFPCDLE